MSDEWEHEKGIECVICPDCAFTFDAIHTDAGVDTYSCPLCAEIAERERAEVAEARLAQAVELLRGAWNRNKDRMYPVEANRDNCPDLAFWQDVGAFLLASYPVSKKEEA